MRDSATALLARASARAARRGVTARTALIDNGGYPVAQLVLAYAKRWKPGVIVLGTHGRRGLQHLLMGSDAETILRESTVPVLLVRTPGDAKKTAGRSQSATRKGSGARAR
jgi:nucleotide-binding universal stress UspA family protein